MAIIDWEQARLRLKASEAALERALKGSGEDIARVYRERAARLATRDQSEGAFEGTTAVMVFRLEAERYAVALSDLAAALVGPNSTPVPDSPPSLEGVINVEGEIRPVLNLRSVLGLSPAASKPPHVLLLRSGGRELGIRVDGVEQVQWISPKHLVPAAVEARSHAIEGLTPDTLIVLKTPALFSEIWQEKS